MCKRKIGIFCESWETGGIESFLTNILLHMDLADMDVDIVAAYIKESVFTADLQAKGVRFVPLSGKLRSLRANCGLFRQLLRKRKYDVFHFNLYQGLSLIYLHIARQEDVPVRIAHSHNTALRKSLTRPLKLFLHRLGSNLFTGDATSLWACSEAAAKFLFSSKELARMGFRFIPNGINTARFAFDCVQRDILRAQMGLSDVFVVGHVGRLCYQKNQDFLLDVFVHFLTCKPESRLLLVGEGEQKDALEEKAIRLGIREKVIFYGVTDQVEHLFWAMDAFAFPSLFEGLGIVAVEAQAAGLPVFCSEHIPSEANITPLFRCQPLNTGAAGWTDALTKSYAPERTGTDDLVRQAGFDVADVARHIAQEYTRQVTA